MVLVLLIRYKNLFCVSILKEVILITMLINSGVTNISNKFILKLLYK